MTTGVRSTRRRVLVVAAVVLLVWALAVVLALLLRDSGWDEEPAQVPLAFQVAGFVVVALGGVVVLVGLVAAPVNWRRLAATPDPLVGLDRVERADLLAQVRGRRPVVPDRIEPARSLATRTAAQWPFPVLFSGSLLCTVPGSLSSPTPVRLVLMALSGAFVVTGGLYVALEVRRARRFLAAHPPDLEVVSSGR
ncbi:hypothetical protein [Geodermatophilus sp. SYSU D01119]